MFLSSHQVTRKRTVVKCHHHSKIPSRRLLKGERKTRSRAPTGRQGERSWRPSERRGGPLPAKSRACARTVLVTYSTPRQASKVEVHLGPVVEHQHQGAADAAHDVGHEPFVETLNQALLSGNFLEAVHPM